MNREEMIFRLKELDEEASLLFDNSERIRLVIVGGGALVLMEYLSRSTHDIDVLSVPFQLHGLLRHYDMNTDVQAYINNFPYNYEDRIKKLDIDTKIIDFYTASLEDVVIAKLCSYREKDQQDIEAPDVVNNIDWELLHELAVNDDEIKANCLSDYNYRSFLQSYTEYERRFRACGN